MPHYQRAPDPPIATRYMLEKLKATYRLSPYTEALNRWLDAIIQRLSEADA